MVETIPIFAIPLLVLSTVVRVGEERRERERQREKRESNLMLEFIWV